jgi:hypothetical protein
MVFELLDPASNPRNQQSKEGTSVKPSSGFTCFVYGFAFEHGDGKLLKANLPMAFTHY